MNDRPSLVSDLLHYVLVLICAYLGLQLAGRLIPDIQLWQELTIALAIAVAYVLVMVRLGFAPDSWFPDRSSER